MVDKIEVANELFSNVEEEAQRSFEISSIIELLHDKLDAQNMDEEGEHLGELTDVCNTLQNLVGQLNSHAIRLNKIFELWSQAVGA